jgi:hypothetical protein
MIGRLRRRARLPKDDRARVEQLRAEGRVVELDELPVDAHVIVIAFAFGDEFWRVHERFRPDPFNARVTNAELVVHHGVRITDKKYLGFLQRPIKRMVYAV